MMHRAACEAMGTRFEIVLHGDEGSRLAPIAEHVIEEIQRWHDRLSLFRRDSFLTYINTHAASTPVPLEPELFELLAMCLEVRAASGGAFDPAVAGLMRALGLHEGSTAEARSGPIADGAFVLDPADRTVRFTSPSVSLDLGAVAKGFALDLAACELRRYGVENALIHGGTSSVMALGAPPGAEAWKIALGPGEDAPVLALRDGALSYSAPGGRSVEGPAGERITHILDPRTGRPAGAVSACVVAATVRGPVTDPWAATRCEAWSTALVVLGDRPGGFPEDLTSAIASGARGERRWTILGPHEPCITLPRINGENRRATPV